MLRKYVFILVLFVTVKSFGCICGCYNVNVTEYYNRANIVLGAKVKKVYESETFETKYYKIDIEPTTIFKGKGITSLMVYGSNGKRAKFSTSSCDMSVLENTVWIFYISKDNNNYSVGMCSGSKRIDEKFSSGWGTRAKKNLEKSRELEFEILNFLKDKKLNLSNANSIYPKKLQVYIDQKRGVDISNRFAFYQVTIKSDLSLKEVKPIQEFDNETVSNEILNILENRENWNILNTEEKIEDVTFLIELYFYPEEEGSKSLISIFTL